MVLLACFGLVAVQGDGDEEKASTAWESFFNSAIEWLASQNPVVFTIAMALWIALCLPSSVVECLPAFVYGYWGGLAVSLVGKNLGNLIACVVARYCFYDIFRRTLMDKYRFMLLLERAFKKGGFRVIALVRAMYLPMALKNYGFAVMDIPLSHIIAAAVMTGLPFASMWAYVGSSARDVSALISGEAQGEMKAKLAGSWMIVLPIAAVALTLIGRYVAALFNEVLEDEKRALAAEGTTLDEAIARDKRAHGTKEE